MKRLQAAGIGIKRRQAEPITIEEEDILWQKGILGCSSPQSPLDTMVYMNGLYFALRGGKEHRTLRHQPAQIQLVEKPGERAYLVYREDMSKNHPGGLKGRKVKPKVAVHHANLENPDRCFVRLYKLYNSLCPPDRPKDAYYLQPLHKPKQECWYAPRPLGHTKLDGTVCRLCREAGIPGYRTNHSLRATTTTRLHQSGVQEQEIMERTGHRSLEGVRSYKRTSSEQMERVSDVLNSGPKRPCLALHDLPKQHQQHSQSVATLPHANDEPSSATGLSRVAPGPVFQFSSCASVTINYVSK